MRVAVTGATGYVGRFIVDALLARGHVLRAWARPTSDRSGFDGAIDWVDGALDRVGSELALLRDADALVHCAFQHIPGRYRGGEGDDAAGFLAVNRDGSERLLAAADQADVQRVVFLSSRAVYGPRIADRPLDENHPTRPDTLYGTYKLDVERMLASRARGRPWASLRATGVYGLGRPLARSKWYEVIGASLIGDAPAARGGTEVAGDDVADAVALLLGVPVANVAGRVFNISDVYVTHRALTRLVGGKLAPPSGPPTGVMATGCLQGLGWRGRGWPEVRATAQRLKKAIEAAAAR